MGIEIGAADSCPRALAGLRILSPGVLGFGLPSLNDPPCSCPDLRRIQGKRYRWEGKGKTGRREGTQKRMRAIKGKDLKEKRGNEERPGAVIQGSSPREGEERKQLYWLPLTKHFPTQCRL